MTYEHAGETSLKGQCAKAKEIPLAIKMIDDNN